MDSRTRAQDMLRRFSVRSSTAALWNAAASERTRVIVVALAANLVVALAKLAARADWICGLTRRSRSFVRRFAQRGLARSFAAARQRTRRCRASIGSWTGTFSLGVHGGYRVIPYRRLPVDCARRAKAAGRREREQSACRVARAGRRLYRGRSLTAPEPA